MAKILSSFKSAARGAFDPMARSLTRAGISPDAITLVGTAGVVVASVVFAARGQLVPATLTITLCALLDVLDGAMARVRGRSSRFGAMLDSTMDRVADGAVFAGLAYWLATSGQQVLAVLCLVSLVGGQVVSYVKARAESVGFTCDVGIAERLERLVILGVGGLLTGFGVSWGLGAALWLLAVLTVVTAAQRVLHVRGQEIRGYGRGQAAPGRGHEHQEPARQEPARQEPARQEPAGQDAAGLASRRAPGRAASRRAGWRRGAWRRAAWRRAP